MPTFVVNSRVTHTVGPLSVDDGGAPRFAQLYVHDAQMAGAPAAVGISAPRTAHATALHAYLTTTRTETPTRNTVDALTNLVDRLVQMLRRVSDRHPTITLNVKISAIPAALLSHGGASHPCEQVNPYAHDLYTVGERLAAGTAATLRQVCIVLHAQRSSNADDGQRRPEARGRGTDAPYHFREIALLADETLDLTSADFVLYLQGGGTRQMQMTHRSFDPLYFVTLFPLGDDGYALGRPYWPMFTTRDMAARYEYNSYRRPSQRTQQLSSACYYAHRLYWRNGETHRGSRRLLLGGRLLQEYAVTALARAEQDRLRYHSQHQNVLRVESLSNLRQEQRLARQQGRNMQQVGQQVILASSFVGGPRDMAQRYQDAIAIVRETRRPSVFLTMTCNPRWPEIVNAIHGNGRAEDHPVIVARVFKQKLDALQKQLLDEDILGKVVAIVSVVEFQYRGLPHAHMLLIFDAVDAHLSVDTIDGICCAEIPADDGDTYRSELRAKVLAHMIHNDCEANPRACMCCERTGRCRWSFPKAFSNETTWTDAERYPRLRRRAPAPGDAPIVIGDRVVDNRWVAPYNAYLLNRYDCHLNVEVCASIEAVKYLYK